IDSWSARLSWTPAPNWSAQISAGRLHHPEAAESGDVLRSTASLAYNRPFGRGHWATSLIWGRNHKTQSKQNTNSYLLESVVQFRNVHYLTGRVELLDRDELFNSDPAILAQLASAGLGTVFRIRAYTLGYTRDIPLLPRLRTALGGNFTLYGVPQAIEPYYGAHPAAFYLFLRLGLRHSANSSGSGSMHHGGM
ncbi:MAG: hypothetical protein ACRD5L_14325, partial [Bryobacteraceae bacterium]